MALHADTFEILRDCRALFLKRLGAFLQESGLVSGNAIAAIQEGTGAYFDEVVAGNQRGSFADEAHGLTASRITLLGEDDLELGIRLDNLTAGLFESTGSGLWKLHLRFVNLLRRPDLPKSDNPLGPKAIGQGLSAMFAAAGASGLEQKLALLDRFETCLRQNLPGLYAELNDFLERGGIETAQPGIVTTAESTRTSPARSENTLLALQQALLAHLPATPAGAAMGGGGAAANLLNQTSLEQLMFRLDALERLGRVGSPITPGSDPTTETLMPALFDESSAPKMPRIIRSAELGIPKSSAESLAIDTLAMIFEAIFDDPELPDALKAAVSSLQIKLLRVAMKDNTLFTDTAHPVRLVLDRMGHAVLGLPLDVPARHPICTRLFELASGLRAEPGVGMAGFENALTELDTLIAERSSELAAAAQSYLPLLDQLDRRDQTATQTSEAIKQGLDRNPPETVRRFLDQVWRQVLLKVGVEHGPDSPQWREHASAIDGLLWSFHPKTAGDDRQALAHRLPQILKILKNGMESIKLPIPEQEAFLDECFKLQRQALRATPVAAEAADPAAVNTAASQPASPNRVLADEIRAERLSLSTLDFADIEAPPSRAAAYSLGDWLSFTLPDGAARLGHVCHISPNSRRALLINPDAGLAIAIHPAILDQQLREGDASILSGLSLFERAATRALRKNGQR